MSKLTLTAGARADLTEIKQYLENQLKNAAAAVRVLARITKNLHNLETFPEMGTPLRGKTFEGQGYRFLVCGSYLAFYRLDHDAVIVDRILYGRRDYAAVLFGGELTAEEDDETK